MPEWEQPGPKVVTAILGRRPEFIRIVGLEGKPLTFILADEIRLEERAGLRTAEEDRQPPS
jgi:hypothetical protein